MTSRSVEVVHAPRHRKTKANIISGPSRRLVLEGFSQVNRAVQAAGIQEEPLSTVSYCGHTPSAEDVALASAGTTEGILYRLQER
jgi:hypothetical protein